MCTVAFLPLPAGGYLLGHNRDESRTRAVGLPPDEDELRGVRFVAPLDPDSGGTWIGANALGVAMCILNAADDASRELPKVPRSRGLVLKEMLHLGSIASARDWIGDPFPSLRDVRAFHLVVAEPAPADGRARVARFRFDSDGAAWDIFGSDPGPRVFVSSSLAQSDAERERGMSFARFLRSGIAFDEASLASWLSTHEPERGPVSVCMHRPDARTVSRTLVEVAAGRVRMAYLEGSPCEAAGREVFRVLASVPERESC